MKIKVILNVVSGTLPNCQTTAFEKIFDLSDSHGNRLLGIRKRATEFFIKELNASVTVAETLGIDPEMEYPYIVTYFYPKTLIYTEICDFVLRKDGSGWRTITS